MKAIARIAIPAVLALSAFSVQAYTVETEYPGNAATAGAAVLQHAAPAPILIQSNSEGPRVDPGYARNTTPAPATAPVIREITLPWGPAHNA